DVCSSDLRYGDLAGELAARVPGHAAPDFSRSRFPGCRRGTYRPSRQPARDALHGQLLRVRALACGASCTPAVAVSKAAAGDRAHAVLRRALSCESVESTPGTKPHQG